MGNVARPVGKTLRVSIFETMILFIASFSLTRRDTFSKLHIEDLRI